MTASQGMQWGNPEVTFFPHDAQSSSTPRLMPPPPPPFQQSTSSPSPSSSLRIHDTDVFAVHLPGREISFDRTLPDVSRERTPRILHSEPLNFQYRPTDLQNVHITRLPVEVHEYPFEIPHLFVSKEVLWLRSEEIQKIGNFASSDVRWGRIYAILVRIRTEIFQNCERIQNAAELGMLVHDQNGWKPDPTFFSLANGFRAGPTLDTLSRPLLNRIFETCWDRSFPEHVRDPFWRACQRLAWVFHAHSDCHQKFHEALVICVHGYPLAITTWCRTTRTQFIPPPQVEIQLAFTHALSHWSAVQELRDGFIRPCAVRERDDVDWCPIPSFYTRGSLSRTKLWIRPHWKPPESAT